MEQKITIYDIAKAASVSPATVSRYIHSPEIVSEKTRKKIQDAFDQLQIKPSDLSIKPDRKQVKPSYASSPNPCILICVPLWNNIFYSQILESIEEYLNMQGYYMIVCNVNLRSEILQKFWKKCSDLNVCGLIFLCPVSETNLRQLYAKYPLVQCSEYNPFCPDIPYVTVDDYSGARQAVSHLIQKGCKKLGFFADEYWHRYVQLRYRGFRETLDSNHLLFDPKYVVIAGDYSYPKLLSSAKIFFELPEPPDGIFAISDMHALAVVNAAREKGIRIPQDLKVIGVDNTLISAISIPAISTVSQPLEQIGLETARILLQQIDNPGDPVESVMLATELLLRETT